MIRQLVTALDEAGVEIDAEAIADALWLARARREDPGEGNQRPAAAGRPAPTEPRPPDAEPRDPIDGAPPESEVEPDRIRDRKAGWLWSGRRSIIDHAPLKCTPCRGPWNSAGPCGR